MRLYLELLSFCLLNFIGIGIASNLISASSDTAVIVGIIVMLIVWPILNWFLWNKFTNKG